MAKRAIHDVAVVGAGMFGSAAAKYLSRAGASVAIIGPAEPRTKASWQSQQVFGSYYDEARITRQLGWDKVWGTADSRSMGRFKSIEEESGVPFFHEVGSLVVMADSIASRTEKILRQCEDDGIKVNSLTVPAMRERFPYLSMPSIAGGVHGLYEEHLAGYLNPRQLVKAQLTLAERAGAQLYRGTVHGVSEANAGEVRKLDIELGGEMQTVHAKTVLIATGAFANFLDVLPADRKLALYPYTEPNLLYELDEQAAQELSGMPAVVTVDPEDTGTNNMTIYLVPPVRYPDGKTYVRIGPGMQPIVRELNNLSEMREWYLAQEITEKQKKFLKGMLTTLLPDVRPVKECTATCVIEKTPTRYFYTGSISDDGALRVVTGGNGHGARGSDEIGRIAAKDVLGDAWDFPLPRETFTPVFLADVKHGQDSGFLKPPFGLC